MGEESQSCREGVCLLSERREERGEKIVCVLKIETMMEDTVHIEEKMYESAQKENGDRTHSHENGERSHRGGAG